MESVDKVEEVPVDKRSWKKPAIKKKRGGEPVDKAGSGKSRWRRREEGTGG